MADCSNAPWVIGSASSHSGRGEGVDDVFETFVEFSGLERSPEIEVFETSAVVATVLSLCGGIIYENIGICGIRICRPFDSFIHKESGVSTRKEVRPTSSMFLGKILCTFKIALLLRIMMTGYRPE